jgi:hypothetical protein
MDPYKGYQTHFGFDHFDLEPIAFSRPANNPYSDYYDPGWKNHHIISWEAQAAGNSAPQFHGLHNQVYLQSNH